MLKKTLDISLLGDELLKILPDIENQIEVVLTHKGIPLAKLMPLSSQDKVVITKSVRIPGAWKKQVWMSDDFNDESKDINDMFYGDVF